MPSLPSGTPDRESKNFPNSLKQPLAILGCSAVLVLISWATVLRAAPQSQAPPPPPPAKAQAPADDAATQASRPALRVVQQMVQVDIIAKDQNGKPIQNLKQSDFTVYDNGRKQDISFFSMETDQTRNLPRPQLTPGTYSNLIEQKEGVPGNLTILLLDFLNTKHSDIMYAKERIIKLLHDMKPDDRVAVYVLSGRLYVLHDFTSDMTALTQVVKKYNTVDSADVANSDFQAVWKVTGLPDVAADAFVNQASQTMSDFANIDRASTTTNVFEIIAQHMMRLPGRKNLIWVSGSFPFSMNTDKSGNSTNLAYETPGSPLVGSPNAYSMFTGGAGSNGAAPIKAEGMYIYENRSFTEDISRATRALASANIAVYPVDPRGLIGANGVETVSSAGYGIGPTMYNNSTSLANLSPNFDTMNTLASQTGGVAYYNNNDIGGEVRQAMEDSRVSYMLAFYPAADDGKGKFHNIKIKVDRPGIELRYRNGYTPKPLNYSGIVDNSAIEREAMASPLDATGLGMTVHTSAVRDATTPTVALRINLEENDVSFKFDDERETGQIEVMLVQYDTEGTAIWVETSKVKMRLVRDMYAKVRKEGLQFGRNLPLKPGAVELKVIACDDKSSSIGSVSIPLAAYLPPPSK
ncbi:MAG TPA: VWA domain-containing protein [Candidatus Acidoferrales bacterium]|jgi:VWFA-related protein